mgnify:CR=1 FL=1
MRTTAIRTAAMAGLVLLAAACGARLKARFAVIVVLPHFGVGEVIRIRFQPLALTCWITLVRITSKAAASRPPK